MNLTGLRPTGRLHLGHFFSVIKPALEDSACDILIANLHANKHVFSQEVNDVCKMLESFGLFQRAFLQEDRFSYKKFEQMTRLVSLGQLERMVSFKSATVPDFNMLVYPIKMVIDILGYEKVYVGKDQVQHIEFARDLIEKFNEEHMECYPLPEAIVFPHSIRDIRNPERKMSKSHPEGCIFLDDSLEEILHKVSKLDYVSDEGQNVEMLCKLFDVELNLSSAAKTKTELSASIYRRINDAKI